MSLRVDPCSKRVGKEINMTAIYVSLLKSLLAAGALPGEVTITEREALQAYNLTPDDLAKAVRDKTLIVKTKPLFGNTYREYTVFPIIALKKVSAACS